MATLGRDSDSSDEEWVFSSLQEQLQKQQRHRKLPTIPKKQQQQPIVKISDVPMHTVRPYTPTKTSRSTTPTYNQALPNQIRKVVTSVQDKPAVTPSLQFISDNELESLCKDMNASALVSRLIHVYKSTEIYIKIREIETQSMSMEARLRNHLDLAQDPSGFIINALFSLSKYFSDNAKNKDLTPKFRRLLATMFCTTLARFFERGKPKGKEEEPDLITFNDDEVDLISFDQDAPIIIPIESDESDESGEEEQDDDDVFALEQPVNKYTLSRKSQLQLISLIDSITSPIVIYYALDVFHLVDLMSFGHTNEEEGVNLCRLLMKHGHYDEYAVCIKKLNLFTHFPIRLLADQLFIAGSHGSLPTLFQDQPDLQKQLLVFINDQLRFNYAGNLGIIPIEKLKDLIDGTNSTPQLSRLKERKFQKELVNCGAKVMKDLGAAEEDYYFITLSQRYASLRFVLAQRAIQQSEDGDLSIEASSNFNGLIDLVCQGDPVLARLAIKELIDTGDTVAPPYFASLYKEQGFYCRYNALPLNQRLLGVVKGEQMSRHRSTFTSKKAPNTSGLEYYVLPPKITSKMVDSFDSLMEMKDTLSMSNVCGIDTEWVPTFAKSGTIKTALMQISSDIKDTVYLLDLKTMFEPENTKLLQVTQKILEIFFEDDHIFKVAYDFNGDFDLLHSSMPISKTWKVTKLLDFKSIKSMPKKSTPQGEQITGGLAGLVSTFLGVRMNKRQQLSNWEQRPLSEKQINYASCDAYCLLDIYYTLNRLNHPNLKRMIETAA